MKKRRLIYEINTARHCLMKYLDSQSRELLDISVVQMTALMLLHEQDGCLMKELADKLMLDKSAVTGLAKRMQARELIEKVPCSEDSRATRLKITDKGRRILGSGVGMLQGVNQQMTEGFSEDEIATVSRFLQHITQTFNQEK